MFSGIFRPSSLQGFSQLSIEHHMQTKPIPYSIILYNPLLVSAVIIIVKYILTSQIRLQTGLSRAIEISHYNDTQDVT